jgi:hypothetical protein
MAIGSRSRKPAAGHPGHPTGFLLVELAVGLACTYNPMQDLLAGPRAARPLRPARPGLRPHARRARADSRLQRQPPMMRELHSRLHDNQVLISLICHAHVALTSTSYRVNAEGHAYASR